MGGKSDPPPAPDYVGAANAQAKSSQEATQQQTWANRPTISTPWGTSSWTPSQQTDPSTGQSVTSWANNIQLAPEQQAALNAQMQIQQGRSQGAQTLLDQSVGAFQQPMDWQGLPQRADQISGNAPLSQVAQGGPMQQSVRAQQMQRGFAQPQQATQGGVDPASIQGSLNGNAQDYRQRAQDAITELQRPDLEHSRQMMDTQLANQGITRGSEAYDEAQRHQGDTEARAGLQAIAEGRNESQLMFGQDLSAGQFGNQAQQQDYAQQMGQAGLANTLNQQQFAQGLARGQFSNESAQAAYQQMLSSGQFRNQAEAQRFQQDMASAQQGDQQAMQRLQMQMQAGNFNNQNRQQALAEEQMRRSQPLNELNALLTGQQVSSPQMPSFTNSTKSDTAQYLPAAQSQYGAAMDAFNANQASSAGLTSGLFSLGSAAMGSPTGWGGLFSMSDVRVKKDVHRVGQLPNGLGIYKYRFIGSNEMQLGVLAQEVKKIMPDAVAEDEHGILHVNYNKVLA